MHTYKPQLGCPNALCRNHHTCGDAFISIHDKSRSRLRCRACGKTWSAHSGAFHYGLRSGSVKIHRAVDMLRAGVSIRKAAQLVSISPSTIMRWKKKLPTHS